MSYYSPPPPPPESAAPDIELDIVRRRQNYSSELAEYSRRALLSAHGQYLQAERERVMMYRAQGYDYPMPPELNLPGVVGQGANAAQSTPPPSLQSQPSSSSSSSSSVPVPPAFSSSHSSLSSSSSYDNGRRRTSFASPPPPLPPFSGAAGGRTMSTELATTFDRMRVEDDRSGRRRHSARGATTTMPTEAERLVRYHQAPTTVRIEEAASDVVAPRTATRRQSSRMRKPAINA